MGPMQRQILRVLFAAKSLGHRGLSCIEIAAVMADLQMESRVISRHTAPWRPTQINSAISGLRFVPSLTSLDGRTTYVEHCEPNRGSALTRLWYITDVGFHALMEHTQPAPVYQRRSRFSHIHSYSH